MVFPKWIADMVRSLISRRKISLVQYAKNQKNITQNLPPDRVSSCYTWKFKSVQHKKFCLNPWKKLRLRNIIWWEKVKKLPQFVLRANTLWKLRVFSKFYYSTKSIKLKKLKNDFGTMNGDVTKITRNFEENSNVFDKFLMKTVTKSDRLCICCYFERFRNYLEFHK